MEGELHQVIYAGMMTFMNAGGVDVGPLEAGEGAESLIPGIKVEKGRYHCHYAVSDDAKRIDAIMVSSDLYPGDVLETPELLGYARVALSGVVGFFSSPKTRYTVKQMGEYLAQLEKEHKGICWVRLNSRQFMAPTGLPIASKVPVYAHRNGNGDVDAIKLEFRRAEGEMLAKAAEEVSNG